jgi:hypothetical protein
MQTIVVRVPTLFKTSSRLINTIKSSEEKKLHVTNDNNMSALFLSLSPFFTSLLVTLVINISLHYRYGFYPRAIIYISIAIVCVCLCISLLRVAKIYSIANSSIVSGLVHISAIISDSRMRITAFYFIISLLCLNEDRLYFNSIMLLVFVNMSQTLRNVVRAVSLPAIPLLLSSMLGLICIFIFSIFGFYFFRNDFYNDEQDINECDTLLMCLTTFIHGGLRSGGGIADHIGGFN